MANLLRVEKLRGLDPRDAGLLPGNDQGFLDSCRIPRGLYMCRALHPTERHAGQHQRAEAQQTPRPGDQIQHTRASRAFSHSAIRSSLPLMPPLMARVIAPNAALSASALSPWAYQNHAALSAAHFGSSNISG